MAAALRGSKNTGVWLWSFAPPPRQTVAVHQAYAIQFPAERELQETSQRGVQLPQARLSLTWMLPCAS